MITLLFLLSSYSHPQVVNNPVNAFSDCSAIIILDELLQQEDEEYDDWIQRNCDFFSSYAQEINWLAKKNVRVLVAGNGPVNFNAMMMIKNAPNVRKAFCLLKCCSVSTRTHTRAHTHTHTHTHTCTCTHTDTYIQNVCECRYWTQSDLYHNGEYTAAENL